MGVIFAFLNESWNDVYEIVFVVSYIEGSIADPRPTSQIVL